MIRHVWSTDASRSGDVAEYILFYRALLQKRPILLRSLLIGDVAVSDVLQSCHTHEVLSYLHITYDETCHVCVPRFLISQMLQCPTCCSHACSRYKWVMSHVWMKHVTYKWFVSHLRIKSFFFSRCCSVRCVASACCNHHCRNSCGQLSRRGVFHHGM